MEAELKRRRQPVARSGDFAPNPGQRVSAMLHAARCGNYFDCLGVTSDVGTSGVREAWLNLSAEIAGLCDTFVSDPEATAALVQIRAVAADAFEILSDPDLRLGYLKALDRDAVR